MSKFTKGRWVAVGAWVEHEDFDIADICSCNPESIGQEHFGRSYKEMCANARLMAASPRLLKALRCIVEMNPELPMGMIEEAQEAIYEATREEA